MRHGGATGKLLIGLVLVLVRWVGCCSLRWAMMMS